MTMLTIFRGFTRATPRFRAQVLAFAVLAIVGLLFVPIGTIFGAIILWYLLQPDVAARFE